ncbi:uncharacterized protein LOC109543862 isoform X2 [Dendroctonus ponderosae]|nr:uncharacterized protein LOC109543862 isoform X2 [Dendroctonus ponderosae]
MGAMCTVCVDKRKMSGGRMWSTESTCKLIELYREHPLLWESKHKHYKNHYKRADALKEICLALNIDSIDDVKKKIKNINTQYTRERKKYKNMRKLGAGKHFVAKWFGYELLGFLRDKNKSPNSLQAGSSTETHESDSSQSSLDGTEADATGNISRDSKPTINFSKTSEKAKINKAVKRKDISQNVERRNEEVYNIMTPLQKDRHEKSQNKPDKFDIMGELVAQKLRGLPTLYAQCTVEHLIHNLLYDAEMGKYNSEPSKPPSSQVQYHSHLNRLNVDTSQYKSDQEREGN